MAILFKNQFAIVIPAEAEADRLCFGRKELDGSLHSVAWHSF